MEEFPFTGERNASDPILDGQVESVVPPQDTFRKVTFGEIADPVYPPHPEPAELAEDDLTAMALEDPDLPYADTRNHGPSAWRVVFLILIASLALAFVFWRH